MQHRGYRQAQNDNCQHHDPDDSLGPRRRRLALELLGAQAQPFALLIGDGRRLRADPGRRRAVAEPAEGSADRQGRIGQGLLRRLVKSNVTADGAHDLRRRLLGRGLPAKRRRKWTGRLGSTIYMRLVRHYPATPSDSSVPCPALARWRILTTHREMHKTRSC
ncbi:MAG: hypothetical protein DLM60_01880 [Pseudonocardiales bacterium]|nr:MAG: hypothetical protein DLM60_01880 [Pseudonocardiales bacterium]